MLPGLSIYGVSIGGAAAHNIGQIGAAMIVLGGTAVLGYLPVLLAVSLLTGTLTGFVAGLLFRAMKNVKLSRLRTKDEGTWIKKTTIILAAAGDDPHHDRAESAQHGRRLLGYTV